MANQEHLDILKQGAEVWNQWRKDHINIDINLSEANLSETDLSEANLRRAYFRRANLSKANLSKADFREAHLWNTTFANVDLSGVNGLNLVNHQGPSEISISTIYRSGGN